MNIALTGATGFLGRYILRRLAAAGHACRCWHRATSDRGGLSDVAGVEWTTGELNVERDAASLVDGRDAVVHSALHHAGWVRPRDTGDLLPFYEKNILGTLRLIEAARAARVGRFVFISTCAVHDVILDDRPLDETHPLWPRSHYGAHKAALEKFVHSYGLGDGYAICSLRPTGIYGPAHPVVDSKWFDLVQSVRRGETVRVERGGKEVHAADVARAVEILLNAPAERITGQAFNCYDMYISEHAVAHLAREISGSAATIVGEPPAPKHQIDTRKLRALGMTFGGPALLRRTIEELLRNP
ncbi:MAG: NAD(P)-dependent oxidoreductase [Phycisphaerae bacterium]